MDSLASKGLKKGQIQVGGGGGCVNLYNAEIFLYKPWRPRFLQFELIVVGLRPVEMFALTALGSPLDVRI